MTPSFLTASASSPACRLPCRWPRGRGLGALVALRRHIPTPCARESGAARGQPPPARNNGAPVGQPPTLVPTHAPFNVRLNGSIGITQWGDTRARLGHIRPTALIPRGNGRTTASSSWAGENLTASSSAHNSPGGGLCFTPDPAGPRVSAMLRRRPVRGSSSPAARDGVGDEPHQGREALVGDPLEEGGRGGRGRVDTGQDQQPDHARLGGP